MGTLFQFIFKLTGRYKWYFAILLILIAGTASYLASQLRFTEDISKVLPQNEAIDNLNFVFSRAGFMDKVILNISLEDKGGPPDPALLVRFADMLVDSMERKIGKELMTSVDKPPDEKEMMQLYDELYHHLPLFLSEADYRKIDSMITPENIRSVMESNYRSLISPVGIGTKKMIARDPLHLTTIALKKLESFRLSDNLKLYNRHLLSKDDRNLLVLITPASSSNTSDNGRLLDSMKQIVEDLQHAGFEDLQVEYFGSPLVALANARRIKQDIMITVSLAAVLLILFISLFFRKKRTFVILFLPVAFGAIVSIAALTLIQSEVSAISLGIGSVLLGISLDYALHLFSHYRKYRDIRLLFKDLSTPILISSLTTAGAFLSLHFINSQALNDLGQFAAVAVIVAALFSLLVLPHLLPSREPEAKSNTGNLIDRIAAYSFARNSYLSYGILLLTVVFIFLSPAVQFDADLMKSNYMSPELQAAEKHLNQVTSLAKKTIYLVTPGEKLNDALAGNEVVSDRISRLREEKIIQDATLIGELFHSVEGQQQAIRRWDDFWSGRKDQFLERLSAAGRQYGFKTDAFSHFTEYLSRDFDTVDYETLPMLSGQYLDNFTIESDTLSAVINVLKVNSTTEDINAAYAALEAIPGAWVIDKRLITSEFMNILKDNFDRLILISLTLVFFILLIAKGRIELTLLTMIPIFFSWFWVVGIMALLGISFNIFNIIILTFIFGLGIDYSIFVMRGLLQAHKYGHQDIDSYKVSVIISGITTLLGIGVLVFARHPALQSIATMSIIGILSVILITFTLLPALFNWMVNYKKGKRNRPVTLLDLLFSLASLLVFVGGSLLMTLFSFILRIVPAGEKHKKYVFHVVFSKMTWFLIYMNFLSPKKIINPQGEDYRRPAIVVANHQSHIDLMLMMLLSPKVLVLTNRRNYTHPFYGKALQYADFLPSDMGYEEIGEDLETLIDQGYSFMIFPEGHRNDDGSIRRFHKGAFYLAEKLGIDILPIIIHGQNQLLKKSEFFLKRGSITTKFLPRIDLKKKEFGETLREQTKGINAWFRKEYAAVREEFEVPAYWADYIVKNFTYKGPVLEWYTRIKLRLEENYQVFNDLIPRKCTITDLGCGYGYLAFMLSMVSGERQILAIDYDEEKIAVARNCAINNDRIHFTSGDITKVELASSDVFILSDVLHYLPERDQVSTLEQCLARLNKGGMMIVRDSDKTLRKRHMGTKLSEFFSTNLGFNKKTNRLEFVSRDMIEAVAARHGANLEILDRTRLTSNLIYVLRPGANGETVPEIPGPPGVDPPSARV